MGKIQWVRFSNSWRVEADWRAILLQLALTSYSTTPAPATPRRAPLAPYDLHVHAHHSNAIMSDYGGDDGGFGDDGYEYVQAVSALRSTGACRKSGHKGQMLT